MALHYRKRGDVWHCRGSVRIGRNTLPVREFSTGCTSKIEGQAVGAAEEARIRGEFLDTGTVSEPLRVVTSATASRRTGHGPVASIASMFSASKSLRPKSATTICPERRRHGVRGCVIVDVASRHPVARWRSTLLAALTYGAEEYGVTVRSIRSVRGVVAERVSSWGRRPMVVMGLGTASLVTCPTCA